MIVRIDVRQTFMALLWAAAALLCSCGIPFVWNADVRAFVDDGISVVQLKDFTTASGGTALTVIPSLAPTVVTLNVINPQDLDISCTVTCADDSLFDAEPTVTSCNPHCVTFSFTPSLKAEHQDLVLTLTFGAPALNRTYASVSMTVHCNTAPLIFSDDYPWWRFYNRPMATQREMEIVRDKLTLAEATAMVSFNNGKNVKYEDRTIDKTTLTGATFDYNKIKDMEFTHGRYFTQAEADNPTYVCIIGSSIAENLFEGRSKIEGEEIRVQGIRLKVVGVFKKEGDNLIGWTLDNMVMVPYSILNTFVNTSQGDGGADPLMAIRPRQGVPVEELKYEVKGVMRSVRKLSPTTDDNFAINQMSVITDQISSLFVIVNIAGFIIGGFSLLVGGFGIANIMFVSVKERTNIIGIKKALGAKQVYILLEFLLEAVMLCILGGAFGMLFVLGLVELANTMLKSSHSTFVFYLTLSNVIFGLSISISIGILAGFIPAFQAARMKPVDAIRG